MDRCFRTTHAKRMALTNIVRDAMLSDAYFHSHHGWNRRFRNRDFAVRQSDADSSGTMTGNVPSATNFQWSRMIDFAPGLNRALLFGELVRVMHLATLVRTPFGDCFWSQLSLASARSVATPPRDFLRRLRKKYRSGRQKLVAHAAQAACPLTFLG